MDILGAIFKYITVYTSTAKLTQSGGDLEMQKILHIIGATFKYNPVCTTTAKLAKKSNKLYPTIELLTS